MEKFEVILHLSLIFLFFFLPFFFLSLFAFRFVPCNGVFEFFSTSFFFFLCTHVLFCLFSFFCFFLLAQFLCTCDAILHLFLSSFFFSKKLGVNRKVTCILQKKRCFL